MSKDAADVKEILDAVSEKIPGIMHGLRDTLFSEEAGRELGKAVGAFYKELVDSSIPPEEALAMAKSYIGSLQSVLSQTKVG